MEKNWLKVPTSSSEINLQFVVFRVLEMASLIEQNLASDLIIKEILEKAKIIALVGASDKPHRPSYSVMKYLKMKGYTVIPVNPNNTGKTILGEPVFENLSAITQQVDLVDIFRKSMDVEQIIDEAIAANARAIWMQIGVIHPKAAKRAINAGLRVVMDRCPKIEIPRLNIQNTTLG